MQAKTLAVRDATAVITGAASGIGAALAHALAHAGAGLALADIDADGLERVAAPLRAVAPRLSTHSMDVGDRDAIVALPEAVAAAHAPGAAFVLVNNAGVSLGGTFEATSEQDFDWLLGINLMGPIRITRVFMPMLRAAPAAQMVMLSSIFGIVAPPGQTAYATSKFGVRGFAESLRHELLDTNIGVTVVHPGGVRTNIAASARIPADTDPAEAARQQAQWARLLSLAPEAAAARILRGIERREWRVLVGSDAVRMAAIQRVLPAGYWRVIARAAGV